MSNEDLYDLIENSRIKHTSLFKEVVGVLLVMFLMWLFYHGGEIAGKTKCQENLKACWEEAQ